MGDTGGTTGVEPAFVVNACGHPALVTRTEPTAWAPRGEVRYLPCALCRAIVLERKLAVVAMHATGRCHCKKADDCHALIQEVIDGEVIGNEQVRRDTVQECLDTIMRARSQWSVRSESKYIPIVSAVDEVYDAVSKLKEIE